MKLYRHTSNEMSSFYIKKMVNQTRNEQKINIRKIDDEKRNDTNLLEITEKRMISFHATDNLKNDNKMNIKKSENYSKCFVKLERLNYNDRNVDYRFSDENTSLDKKNYPTSRTSRGKLNDQASTYECHNKIVGNKIPTVVLERLSSIDTLLKSNQNFNFNNRVLPTADAIILEKKNYLDVIDLTCEKDQNNFENHFIRVLEDKIISNIKVTFIKKKYNNEEVKVLIHFSQKQQITMCFTINGNNVPVSELMLLVYKNIPHEYHNIYEVDDPISKFSYVITASPLENKTWFCLNEDSNKETTEILWISTCSSANKCICDQISSTKKLTSDLKRNSSVILSYPPPPIKWEANITVDDFKCLDPNQNLNDVIIHFYLQYLMHELLSDELRRKVHLFNTFFYTRLSNPRLLENQTELTLAERQYNEVKRWTKKIGIFEKDFIIIPVHQKSHWFLAIICYPSLIKNNLKTFDEFHENSKKPSIMIFDSLTKLSVGRSKVANDIKMYLKSEFDSRKDYSQSLPVNDIKIIYPNVPQQQNCNDCGLFLLQYVESFIKDFIVAESPNFSLIEDLTNWFDHNEISEKRNKIKRLLVKLKTSPKIN
ncbi:sentrin-specific protease 7-like isoform X2 [Trichogramma pretiosum]|uniref:sentrin-specific protease 7-like isoform X2 n=1 Tax=Trichogramma pretiosum TaxID=7493 RepID=UPI0006C94150|nr:sentrin-specific protease 7-like isoform X2 [Trichogramma pretiosum]